MGRDWRAFLRAFIDLESLCPVDDLRVSGCSNNMEDSGQSGFRDFRDMLFEGDSALIAHGLIQDRESVASKLHTTGQ